ncbi:MAG: hypothetical protein ABJC19_04815 [Gemmatimonadota bacterium]
MIGKRYWIWIWYGILLLGVVGLAGAIHWGRQTSWRNLDEVLRGVGTICVSCGMLLLLYGSGGGAGQTLLLAALISFILAFAIGREPPPPPSRSPDTPA